MRCRDGDGDGEGGGGGAGGGVIGEEFYAEAIFLCI